MNSGKKPINEVHLSEVFDHGKRQNDVVVVVVEEQGLQVRVQVELGAVPSRD